jgi:hypothetical protein
MLRGRRRRRSDETDVVVNAAATLISLDDALQTSQQSIGIDVYGLMGGLQVEEWTRTRGTTAVQTIVMVEVTPPIFFGREPWRRTDKRNDSHKKI